MRNSDLACLILNLTREGYITWTPVDGPSTSYRGDLRHQPPGCKLVLGLSRPGAPMDTIVFSCDAVYDQDATYRSDAVGGAFALYGNPSNPMSRRLYRYLNQLWELIKAWEQPSKPEGASTLAREALEWWCMKRVGHGQMRPGDGPVWYYAMIAASRDGDPFADQ